jgi:hypothetical protein
MGAGVRHEDPGTRGTAMNNVARVPPRDHRRGSPATRAARRLDDGVTREVDLTGELGGPMFEPLKNPDYFAPVTVDHGTVVWPNGVDLDPLALHGDLDPTTSQPQQQVG